MVSLGPLRCLPVISWGDFPTWALAIIALLALIAAGAAYFKQADAAKKLAEQVDLQRQQLEDQKQVNTRQIKVLDAQLLDMKRRTKALERQQADAVTVEMSVWSGGLGDDDVEPEALRMAIVSNGSHRPIRDVDGRVHTIQDDAMWKPEVIAYVPKTWTPDTDLERSAVIDHYEWNRKFRLLAAGETGAIIFDLVVNPDLEERLTVRFTDDAGLYWQIDHDLHLKNLDNRDDW